MHKEKVEGFIAKKNIIIVEALRIINDNAMGVLFVVDDQGKLIGSLSDGDIRRWLIKTGNLNATIDSIMNENPRFLYEDDINNATKTMTDNTITAIPILNKRDSIIGVICKNTVNIDEKVKSDKLKGVPVVMMAGGKGTRLYPYTKILPKPLIPVGEKPIAEIIIDSFCEYGCKDYYLIVNHRKKMIKAYFNECETDYNIHFVDEEKPLGTGGGVSLLSGQINETFILTNCDNVVVEDYAEIYNYHKEHKNLITMICSLKNFSIPYGVVNLADEGTIKSMEEKPTFSFFTNTGCYIVEPEVINDIPSNTSIGFPDIIDKYRREGKRVGVYPINENSWLDMGEIDALEKMREYLDKNSKKVIW